MAENGKRNPIPLDNFGIVAVFSAHLDLSLETSHPEQAAKAAYAAVDAYLKSYQFALMNHKGTNVPEYRMIHRKPNGGGPV